MPVSRLSVENRDRRGDTIKRTVCLAECEAAIFAVGAGNILGEAERGSNVDNILGSNPPAARHLMRAPL
jgi:hypothetical protein